MDTYPGMYEELQRYFPKFDYANPVGDRAVLCDMSNPDNKVGHQQRAFTCYWAMKFCGPLDLGLDLGSARGLTPYCIHVDKFATGEPHPHYESKDPTWSDVIGDMADLSVFPKNAFPYVCSNHSLEHVDVSRFLGHVVPRPVAGQKRDITDEARRNWISLYPRWRDAYDKALVDVMRTQWLRVLRPGGHLAIVVPDNGSFDVLGCDSDHRHAWNPAQFKEGILDRLADVCDVVELDTLKNKFSFNVLLRKR